MRGVVLAAAVAVGAALAGLYGLFVKMPAIRRGFFGLSCIACLAGAAIAHYEWEAWWWTVGLATGSVATAWGARR